MPTRAPRSRPRVEGGDAARRLRKTWGNPEQPIADLFTEIESRTAIRVVRWPFAGRVDGGIFGDKHSRVMLINTREHTLARQRSTAAHELGHFEEDGGDTEFAEVIDTSKPAEGFADGFAIELLMPEAGVRDWVRANLPTELVPADAARLAAYFDTSYEMTVIRLGELDLMKRQQKEEFLRSSAKRAAFAGAVADWFERGLGAIGSRELPASYVSGARGAYTGSLIKLARLAELEFDSIENVRARLREQGLLGETEGAAEEEGIGTATSPESTSARKGARPIRG